MMRKILAVGISLVSLFARGYDVGDYVQDGLVAQYDGIRNVGATLPHNAAAQARQWMTVDLVSGVVSYHDYDFTTATNVFNTEEYKSTKMAFRRVQAGDDYYVQNGAYTAQMTNSYYIGIFEVTIAQMSWMSVRMPTGSETREALRSVGKCNRAGIRGFSTSPAAFGANITEDSTLGRFNAYVQASNDNSRLVFDLPTEAMWEVAARAIDSGDETHSDWNWFFGKTADDIAQYAFLKNDTTDDGYGNISGARVPGARLPNAWGLYDVYGNHYDLCLDGADGNNSPECKQGNWTETPNKSNTKQRTRGGAFQASTANDANSLYRGYHDSGAYDDTGFRLARICTPEEEDYYTATWADEDGSPLGPAETYVAGRTPRYTGALPTKPSANGVDYYFAGWSPEPSRLVSNTVYRAVFHAAAKRTWMDLDLRSGIATYQDYDFATATNVFNTELYKTERMAFRRVECGDCYFVQNGAYTAQMTNSYYIGLFEVTEAQYALMKNPAAAANGLKAQGMINRTAVRGVADAPAAFGVDITPESPLGIMNANLDRRSCAKGVFDLPTEAMWEVAARAVDSADSTHSGWNWFFGKTADDIAQYAFLKNDTTDDGYGNTSGARVPGARLPNAWGLYDVYGNHYDLCLDGADGINSPECKQGNWTEATNKINTRQRTRGGSFSASTSNDANSLYRSYHDSGAYADTGIRLAYICTPTEEDVVFVPASVTGTGNFYIPYDWFASFPSFAEKFGDDYPAAAVMPTDKTTADGSPAYVWQDFVNGCDPTNPEDVFRATIEFKDGEPCVGWEPNLNSNGINRIYSILGKKELADAFGEWRKYQTGDRFFKVTVAMPDGVSSSDEPGPVARERNLLCHLSFDDYGNDGLNVLKVDGGESAIVRLTKSTVVTEGLGGIAVVTDSSVLAGLEPGDGAVYIPMKTHLALPIPSALLDREGHPYTIKMKVKFPSFGKYYSLLNMPASNDSDVMVFLTSATDPAITMKITNKGAGGGIERGGGFTANQWEEVTLQFGEENTKVLLNGRQIFSYDVSLSSTFADCSAAGGYFVISGDNDSDDNAMYWADVKVYDGIVDP